MSKLWKLILGVVIGVLVLGAVGTVGFIAGRRTAVRALAQRPGPSRQLEVRLIDDNKDGIPDRGVIELPAEQAGPNLLDRPRPEAANPGFGPGRGQPFGRMLRPGRPPLFGLLFTPFLLIGGLIRGLIALAFLALLASLAVYFYRRWQPTRLVTAPVNAPVEPVEDRPTPPTDVQESTD